MRFRCSRRCRAGEMYLTPEQIQFLNAADRGDAGTVRALLAAGVDVNTADPRRLPKNRTALMHAANGGHLDVVEVLIAAGAKVNMKDKGLGAALPGGNTALLLALKNRHGFAWRKSPPKPSSAPTSWFCPHARSAKAGLRCPAPGETRDHDLRFTIYD